MNVYTHKQVKDAWHEYKEAKVVRYLVNGKWKIIPLTGKGLPQNVGATRAQYVSLSQIIDFPGYLEKWKQNKRN